MVAVTHVSNVLGTILPVAEIVARARAAGAVSLVTAPRRCRTWRSTSRRSAQTSMRGPDTSARTDGDRRAARPARDPGGNGAVSDRRRHDRLGRLPVGHLERAPYKFEAGTPPIAEAVGLGAAVEYLGQIGMDRVRAHERALTGYTLERLGMSPAAHHRSPEQRRAVGWCRSRSRDAPTRHRRAGRSRRRLYPRGAPLRAAVDALPRRKLDRAREHRRLQRVRGIDALVDALLAGRVGVRL